jgi:hypothetical protein
MLFAKTIMGKEGLPYKLQKEVAKEKLNQIRAYDVPSKARYTNNWAIIFCSRSKEGKKFRIIYQREPIKQGYTSDSRRITNS